MPASISTPSEIPVDRGKRRALVVLEMGHG